MPSLEDAAFNGIFDPVWKCIYCGQTENLEREHVVPFGLGGKLILPRSSCRICAVITGTQVEQPILREMFLYLRTRHRIQTRRPKERPAEFEISWESVRGRIFRKIQTGRLPCIFFAAPSYDEPGVMLGRSAHERGPVYIRNCLSDDIDHLFAVSGSRPFNLPQVTVHPTEFCRMLAKIAHAFACALLGEDGFKHCLPQFILGQDQCASTHWVGGSTEHVPTEPYLYTLNLCERTDVNGEAYLGVTIRLFAYLDAPIYWVVVGQKRGDKLSVLKNRAYAEPVHIRFSNG